MRQIHFRHGIASAVSAAFGAALGYTVLAPHALAQEQVQRVEVTGSAIKRVLEEQALPVTVITREQIERSGATSVEDLVATFSMSSTVGAVTGSLMAGYSTNGQSSISLRGLGAGRTLVLVNGLRLAPFGFAGAPGPASVDLNGIPMAAIERVEVLTDGASSIYGSDAIAGVVNFILRSDFRGAQVDYEYGEPTRNGGGQVTKTSATFGFGSLAEDRYNIFLNLSEGQHRTLSARDRTFAANGNNPPFYTSGATGTGNVEGRWVLGTTDRTALIGSVATGGLSGSGATFYGNPAVSAPTGCAGILMFLSAAVPRQGAAPGNGVCRFDSAPYVGLFPETTDRSLYGSFRFKLNSQNEFFTEALWKSTISVEAIQPSPQRTSFVATDTAFAGSGVDPALIVTPTNSNYPAAWVAAFAPQLAGQPLAVTLRTFLAGPRTERDDNTQTRLALGFKGTVLGGDYQASLSRDTNTTKGGVTNGFFSQVALARVLNAANTGNPATDWNPWALGGVQPPAVAAALGVAQYVGATTTARFNVTGFDGKFSGSLWNLSGGPIVVASGVQVRKEDWEQSVPAILGSGDIAGFGGAIPNVLKGRTVTGLFAEVNAPFFKTFEATGSIRVDRYTGLTSDSKPATGKLSARWTPIQQLVLRGSAGKGFRAPSMSELHNPPILGASEQFIDPLDVAGGPIQVNALLSGNTSLKPEKSKQWSVGAIVSPIKNLSARADYFHIKVDSYIISPPALALVNAARAGSPLFGPGDVIFAPDGSVVQVDESLRNAGVANFSGWDLGANWQDKFSFGNLGANYAGTYMDKAQVKVGTYSEDAVATLVDASGVPLLLPIGGGVILRYKHYLSLYWTNGPWSASVTQNYYSRYRTGDRQVDAVPNYVRAYSIFDAQAQYRLLKSLTLTAGVRNLLNKDPSVYVPAANYFQFGYDPGIYDPRGRFVYVRASYNF